MLLYFIHLFCALMHFQYFIALHYTAKPSVRITWKPEYAGPPHLFSLPHRAHAVAENLGTEGPHTYFSVIRLLAKPYILFYSDAVLIITSGSLCLLLGNPVKKTGPCRGAAKERGMYHAQKMLKIGI